MSYVKLTQIKTSSFSKTQMIWNFMLSPVFCFHLDFASYLAFLALFAYVVLGLFSTFSICSRPPSFNCPSKYGGIAFWKRLTAKICIRITMLEYILVIWLIGIQAERIKKFLALPSKTFGEKILLASKDKWNFIYFLSLMTFIAGLALRVVSTLDYQGSRI